MGEISRETAKSWYAARVEPLGCRGNPLLSIGGDDSGPNSKCIETYQDLRMKWGMVMPHLMEDIIELRGNYAGSELYHGNQSQDEVWNTAFQIGITIFAEGQFTLTYHFDWQDTRDSHLISFHFENWLPAGTSIDG